MRYHEFQPSPALSSHLECLWLLEQDAAPPDHPPERLLPDGCIELILNCGARFRQFDAAGGSALQPAYFVVGQMTQKLLGRVLRFQQVFRAVESERADWATVALSCGYYDQAHLIRDFREFADRRPPCCSTISAA